MVDLEQVCGGRGGVGARVGVGMSADVGGVYECDMVGCVCNIQTQLPRPPGKYQIVQNH